MTNFRVGVDIGGTFTDIVFLGERGGCTRARCPRAWMTTRGPSSKGSTTVFRGYRARRGVGGRDPARHHGRVQRHPRDEGRAHRAHHHRGLSRRARASHPAHAAALRHRLGEAAAAGASATCASRSTSASTRRATWSGRSTGPMRERAVDRLLAEGVEAIAVCLLNCVRQPGARAAHQDGHRRARAGPAALHQLRRAAGDQGVRAHLDHGHQRLRDADRRALPALAAPRAGQRPASTRRCC